MYLYFVLIFTVILFKNLRKGSLQIYHPNALTRYFSKIIRLLLPFWFLEMLSCGKTSSQRKYRFQNEKLHLFKCSFHFLSPNLLIFFFEKIAKFQGFLFLRSRPLIFPEPLIRFRWFFSNCWQFYFIFRLNRNYRPKNENLATHENFDLT